MNDKKIAIVGCGFVGKSTAFALNIPQDDCFDSQGKVELNGRIQEGHYDYLILCVPTPTANGNQDISAIEEWLEIGNQNLFKSGFNPLVIIRSTILPGTTKRLSEKYDLQITHVPEFLSEATAIEDELNPEFLVIGADDILVKEKVKKIFTDSKIQPKHLLLCSSVTAELIKYSLNSFFALKVIFGNQIWDVTKKVGADYEKVQEVLSKHKWGSKNGWNVWQGNFRGYSGSCLLPSTLILTSNNVKEIKDVCVGDKILTFNGIDMAVTEVFNRKINEKVFYIKTQGAGEMGITREHPVLAIKAGRNYELKSGRMKFSNSKKNICAKELEWVNAEDLEKGDFLVIPRIKIKSKNMFSLEEMRLLGYYLANGSIYENRVSICFNSKHTESIKDAKKIIEKYFSKVYLQRSKETMVNLRLTNKKLADFLIAHASKYAHLKRLSEDVLLQDIDRIVELMRGYFRCDGSLSCSLLTIVTVSRTLFYQLQIILNRLGVAYVVNEFSEKISADGTHHRHSYYIRIGNFNEIEKCLFVDKLPNKDLKLRRSTSYIDKDFYYIPIKSIEDKAYKGLVYNLEIDGNHTYVASAGIVHNCLPKDIKAFISAFDLPLLKEVERINEELINK